MYYYHLDNLNTQICRTLKKSPYEVVFGQPPRSTPFPQLPAREDSIIEEDILDLVYERGIMCIMHIR